jgi:hypothetical protein
LQLTQICHPRKSPVGTEIDTKSVIDRMAHWEHA